MDQNRLVGHQHMNHNPAVFLKWPGVLWEPFPIFQVENHVNLV